VVAVRHVRNVVAIQHVRIVGAYCVTFRQSQPAVAAGLTCWLVIVVSFVWSVCCGGMGVARLCCA
jgi:hypothetical protein